MNKVYKSIWNAVTRSWTAVSEAQHSRSKKSKSGMCVLTTLALFCLSPELSLAYDNDEDISNDRIFSIGVNTPNAIDDGDTNFHGNNTFRLVTSETSLNSDVLFSLSSAAYEQVVFQTNHYDWEYLWIPPRYTNIGDLRVNGVNESSDSITQRQAGVATLTFAVGDAAFKLMQENRDSYASDRIEFGDDYIRVLDQEYGWKQYGSNGLAYESTDTNEDGVYSFFTLAVLKEVNIDNGKTLVLDSINGD